MNIEKIQTILKDNFVAAATYGIGKNTVLVVKDIDLDTLLQVKTAFKKDPLILRQRDIDKGADVFALDYLDITVDYTMVAGQDVFKDIVINKKHLRTHLEYTLRSKLIVLYQKIVASKSKYEIQNLLKYTPQTIVPILRGLVFAKNKNHKQTPEELLATVEKLYDIDCTGLKNIFKQKYNTDDINKVLEWLKIIIAVVDQQ